MFRMVYKMEKKQVKRETHRTNIENDGGTGNNMSESKWCGIREIAHAIVWTNMAPPTMAAVRTQALLMTVILFCILLCIMHQRYI
jgi:hypothetical protein